MATTTLKLEIVTPAGTVYSEDVEMVTLPGVAGQMGIYQRHVPLMTQLVPGEMIVRKEGRDLFIATGEGRQWLARALAGPIARQATPPGLIYCGGNRWRIRRTAVWMRACRVWGSPDPASWAWAEPRQTTVSEPGSTMSRISVPSLYWRVTITGTLVLPTEGIGPTSR